MKPAKQRVLNEEAWPYWIRDLLTRLPYSCADTPQYQIRRDILCERVIEVADNYAGGREQLRTACCAHLSHEDADIVVHALSCLFVVGLAIDAPAVESLLSHEDEHIRKAAKTCIFELRRRPIK